MDRAQLEAEVVALYEQHAEGLLRYATGMAHSDDLARDGVQETFLRYFVERTYGRAIELPRAWLYLVLRNYIFDRLTSGPATRELGDQDLSGVTDPGGDPEVQVQRSQIADRIAASLSERERECLGLRSEGFSYLEIAGLMGLRTGTVGALLTRANQKIRNATSDTESDSLDVVEAVHRLFRGGEPCPLS